MEQVEAQVETKDKNILLDVRNIKKYFPIKGGILKRTVGHVKAVDDVSFHVRKGERLGIVGESGSGKSTLGQVILRLTNPTEGKVIFEGDDISTLKQKQVRPYRRNMQIVFQDPFASLNSKMSVGELIEEPLLVQTNLYKKERKEEEIQLIEKVDVREDEREKYQNELSEWQRRRNSIELRLII